MAQPSKTCDVIIPAFNSAATLPTVLQALYEQAVPAAWKIRVIVSDDGSQDATLQVAKRSKAPVDWRKTLFISHTHTGVAGARNRALVQADAGLIFFLGSDIVLQSGALAAHILWHERNFNSRCGAVGFVMWDPPLKPTPFMEWMVHGGPQNNFDDMLGVAEVDPRHFFYASHLSVPREVLRGQSFSEAYSTYGWEDLDLGMSLSAQEVRLIPIPQAVGLHRHQYTAADIFCRQQLVGQGYVDFLARNADETLPQPTLKRYIKVILYRFSGLRAALKMIVAYTSRYWSTPHIFLFVTSGEFWLGVFRAKKPFNRSFTHSS